LNMLGGLFNSTGHCREEINSCPCQELNPGTANLYLSYYTNWAVLVSRQSSVCEMYIKVCVHMTLHVDVQFFFLYGVTVINMAAASRQPLSVPWKLPATPIVPHTDTAEKLSICMSTSSLVAHSFVTLVKSFNVEYIFNIF
jgi:hypothetical protein